MDEGQAGLSILSLPLDSPGSPLYQDQNPPGILVHNLWIFFLLALYVGKRCEMYI